MTDKNLNVNEISRIMLEMSSLVKKTISIFPSNPKYEFLLKNLASASIHLGLFARDLNNYMEGIDTPESYEDEEKFLSECGCKEQKE